MILRFESRASADSVIGPSPVSGEQKKCLRGSWHPEGLVLAKESVLLGYPPPSVRDRDSGGPRTRGERAGLRVHRGLRTARPADRPIGIGASREAHRLCQLGHPIFGTLRRWFPRGVRTR